MTRIAPLLLIISTLFVQLSSGINYVTIPVEMHKQGYDNTMIGTAMSFEIVGMLLLFRPLSHCIGKWGLFHSLVAFTLIRATSLYAMTYCTHYPLWLVSIFCYGLSTGLALVITQTWLNMLAQGKSKGLFMGLFSSALSCGVALGPVALQLPMLKHIWPFELGTLITCIPLCLYILMRKQQSTTHEMGKVRFLFAFRHAKVILTAAFVGGISFFGLPSFLTLYGMQNGLSEPQSQLLLTMFMIGSVSLGMLMSTLSSLINRSIIVLICLFCSVVCAVYLSLSIYTQYWLALALLFFWGGSLGGIYGIGLASLGERFAKQDQMTANMSHSIMDSLGGMAGLLIIGIMLDTFGPEGMTAVFVTVGSALLVFFVYELLVPRPTYE
ncbi:putative MFS family transporter protein [Marinomonas spartinae]|uniref:MFS transporter n=1 Tax=Marinomonas spartinae TaxID=1792290 RepID=UPI000808CB2E|nr:MFS transporter [Marinomonas spartinae]SBS31084.1 putative MFS family transporter protein [Marinomonas spartinae]